MLASPKSTVRMPVPRFSRPAGRVSCYQCHLSRKTVFDGTKAADVVNVSQQRGLRHDADLIAGVRSSSPSCLSLIGRCLQPMDNLSVGSDEQQKTCYVQSRQSGYSNHQQYSSSVQSKPVSRRQQQHAGDESQIFRRNMETAAQRRCPSITRFSRSDSCRQTRTEREIVRQAQLAAISSIFHFVYLPS
jgi:hypothetical protein